VRLISLRAEFEHNEIIDRQIFTKHFMNSDLRRHLLNSGGGARTTWSTYHRLSTGSSAAMPCDRDMPHARSCVMVARPRTVQPSGVAECKRVDFLTKGGNFWKL
jgi:hypothetical protein